MLVTPIGKFDCPIASAWLVHDRKTLDCAWRAPVNRRQAHRVGPCQPNGARRDIVARAAVGARICRKTHVSAL
eukprot:241645-Pyramimonas_sp.AAC.1